MYTGDVLCGSTPLSVYSKRERPSELIPLAPSFTNVQRLSTSRSIISNDKSLRTKVTHIRCIANSIALTDILCFRLEIYKSLINKKRILSSSVFFIYALSYNKLSFRKYINFFIKEWNCVGLYIILDFPILLYCTFSCNNVDIFCQYDASVVPGYQFRKYSLNRKICRTSDSVFSSRFEPLFRPNITNARTCSPGRIHNLQLCYTTYAFSAV